MEKVSVIIPVYNVEKYLNATLSSVVNQTYENLEIICVNDGSTDNSLEILQEFAQKDKRIVLIEQPNQGVSVARNTGLKMSKGTFVYFFDSDDIMHPDLIKTTLYFAKKYNADLVSFRWHKITEPPVSFNRIDENKIKFVQTNNPLRFVVKKGTFGIHYNPWSKLCKRTLVEDIKFVENIRHEDCAYTYAMLAKCPKTIILDAKLYFYMINPNSFSARKKALEEVIFFQKILDYNYNVYQNEAYLHLWPYIQKTMFPKLIKKQIKCYQRADQQSKKAIHRILTEELKDFKKSKAISWHTLGILLYIKCLNIIKHCA